MSNEASAAPSITVRSATADDSVAIAFLLDSLGYPAAPDAIPDRLRRVSSEGGSAFLAAASGRAVGLVTLASHSSLHAPGPVAYITALVVAPEARRLGVGRQLVHTAEGWARSRGCARLSVTSAEHRDDAHAFYPRCGLAYAGRRYSMPLEPPPCPAPRRAG
jgi:GNAT superfamily N-acetyltransferase